MGDLKRVNLLMNSFLTVPQTPFIRPGDANLFTSKEVDIVGERGAILVEIKWHGLF
jgi:hypothetical protein